MVLPVAAVEAIVGLLLDTVVIILLTVTLLTVALHLTAIIPIMEDLLLQAILIIYRILTRILLLLVVLVDTLLGTAVDPCTVVITGHMKVVVPDHLLMLVILGTLSNTRAMADPKLPPFSGPELGVLLLEVLPAFGLLLVALARVQLVDGKTSRVLNWRNRSLKLLVDQGPLPPSPMNARQNACGKRLSQKLALLK